MVTSTPVRIFTITVNESPLGPRTMVGIIVGSSVSDLGKHTNMDVKGVQAFGIGRSHDETQPAVCTTTQQLSPRLLRVSGTGLEQAVVGSSAGKEAGIGAGSGAGQRG